MTSSIRTAKVQILSASNLSRIEINYDLCKNIKIFVSRDFESHRSEIMRDFLAAVEHHAFSGFEASREVPIHIAQIFLVAASRRVPPDASNMFGEYTQGRSLFGGQTTQLQQQQQQQQLQQQQPQQTPFNTLAGITPSAYISMQQPPTPSPIQQPQTPPNTPAGIPPSMSSIFTTVFRDIQQLTSRPESITRSDLNRMIGNLPTLIQQITNEATIPTNTPATPAERYPDTTPAQRYQSVPEVMRTVYVHDGEPPQAASAPGLQAAGQPASGLQSTSGLQSAFPSPLPSPILNPVNQVIHPLSTETMSRIANSVHRVISTTSVRPPDFANSRPSNMRKIKNFVHNITHVWLNTDELVMFITEINRLLASPQANARDPGDNLD